MPKLYRRNNLTWCRIDGHEVLISADHMDARRARYWRAVLDGRPITVWLPRAQIAAIAAENALRNRTK